MSPSKPLHYRRRFPAEIISQRVWLYFRVFLGYQDIEEMIAEFGVIVTYETLCNWLKKLRGTCARRRRSRSTQPGVRRHLDEVFLSISGKLLYRWRAIIIYKP
jgi:putative transposase